MSCSIQALNADASFCLSFTPPPLPGFINKARAFTVVVDPWLSGPSNIVHRKFSTSKNLATPLTKSLALMNPDVIIISQEKSDHCNKETLKTLPAMGGSFIILAEPAAAKEIRSWKYFAAEKVVTLPKWEEGVHEIDVPGASTSNPGKIVFGFIAPKWSLKAPAGLHKTIAISYKAPASFATVDTPPQTPPEAVAMSASASTPRFIYPGLIDPRPVSIIFAPHGCNSVDVEKYALAHFSPIKALPLSALLHCFDEVNNPAYLGGNICKGLPGGLALAKALSPEVWISAHDGDKEVKGLSIGALTITKHDRNAVEQAVSPRDGKFSDVDWEHPPPEVVKLGVGELYMLPRGIENLCADDEELPVSPRQKKGFGMVFGNGFPAQAKLNEFARAIKAAEIKEDVCDRKEVKDEKGI
jgi:hypothetical protein